MNISQYKICLVGLGYVGLPLAIEASKYFNVIGYDINESRIDELKKGTDLTKEVSEVELKKSKIALTSDVKKIKDCNVYIVTVPTPVDRHNVPNLNPLKLSSSMIGEILNYGDIVIYESTVYPGATEEVCVPILEKNSGLVYNEDFFCGYSPERINPGDKKHTIESIIKLTSGSNERTADIIDSIYKKIIPAGTYKVSSIKVAEAAKVIENIQRDVNIALVNELSILFEKMKIDTQEVINAAKTKWNFIPFYPGFVGGHCIGVDPYYLTHKAKEFDFHPEIILSGRRINDNMDKFVYDCTIAEMVKKNINPTDSKIAVFGITFKENCPDLRNTKVPKLINHLKNHGCNLDVFDPIANREEALKLYNLTLSSDPKKSFYDTLIISVAHEEYKNTKADDWTMLLRSNNGVVMDIKSLFHDEYFSDNNKNNISHWRL